MKIRVKIRNKKVKSEATTIQLTNNKVVKLTQVLHQKINMKIRIKSNLPARATGG